MQKNDPARRKLKGNWMPPQRSGYEPDDYGIITIDGDVPGFKQQIKERKLRQKKASFRKAVMSMLRELLNRDDVDEADKDIAWQSYLEVMKASDDEVWEELADLRRSKETGGM